MSDINLISPLLDGFSVGSPISDHDGVTCCPAIREHTDEQYIVKIITIPASQTQLDALLLTGAYTDPADAMEYFRRQGEDILKEAESLKKLSRLEGFYGYDRWQMEPITRKRLGYQVYLISPFRQSLDKYVRGNPMTHLQAINLGLDLCSALTFCRQAGALYVDLKPANIFLSGEGSYRIGDLGFVPLDAMSYTVIPDKYRSVYTPPELHDPMASMNMTADTYAVGMILYQLYNDGQLPFREKAPQEALPSPLNADYELAEIILRAVHPDPFQRWNDPRELGQALRAYMQRNTVNDDPITVYTPLAVDLSEENAGSAAEADSGDNAPAEEEQADSPDETAPGETDAEDVLPHELSDEVSKIVAKADDLISHETPGGVVLPEIPEPEDPFAFAAVEDENQEDASVPREPLMEEPEEPKPETEKKKKDCRFISPEVKRRRKKRKAVLITAAAVAVIGAVGLLYYRNVYQLPIQALSVSSTKDSITVYVDSSVSDNLLKLTCTDSGGRSTTQDVLNGKALFTGLNPDSTYTIRLQAQGFHALTGPSEKTIDTAATTNLLSLNPLAGSEDGSVILSFEMEGDEPDEWTLSISAEGEESRVQSFTGHSVTVTDLTVGKKYTFTISAADLQTNSSISVSGQTSVSYLATRLILAKSITADLTGEGGLAIGWKTPGDVVVENWTVRCYNEDGYDQSVTTESCDAFFESINPAAAYTVEITAQGMSQPARLEITENAIQVAGFTLESVGASTIELTWDASGAAPEGGWLLSYSVDGNALPSVIRCEGLSADIEPRIPGAVYRFRLAAADGTTVYGGSYTYECPPAQPFDENKLSPDTVEGHLLKTPEEENWRYESVGSDAFTDSFLPGDRLSLVLHATEEFYHPGTEVEILYVIRDSLGNVQPDLTGVEKRAWSGLWEGGDVRYGELDIPHAPVFPGDYTLDVYVNGKALVSLPFHIQ